MGSKLGKMLVDNGVIDVSQLQKAIDRVQQSNGSEHLVQAIVSLGILDEEDVVENIARYSGLPTLDLEDLEIAHETEELLSLDARRKFLAIPYFKDDDSLWVVMADPTDTVAIDAVSLRTRSLRLKLSVASVSSILDHLGGRSVEASDHVIRDDMDQRQEKGSPEVSSLADYEKPAVVNLVNQILKDLILRKTDALFVEGDDRAGRARTRIGGSVYELANIPGELMKGVVDRIKIMARVDLGLQRYPQSGHMRLKVGHSTELLFKVSTIPTVCGENIVVLSNGLNSESPGFGLGGLGLDQAQLEVVRSDLHRHHGMIIVCGPSGSGRATTLQHGERTEYS